MTTAIPSPDHNLAVAPESEGMAITGSGGGDIEHVAGARAVMWMWCRCSARRKWTAARISAGLLDARLPVAAVHDARTACSGIHRWREEVNASCPPPRSLHRRSATGKGDVFPYRENGGLLVVRISFADTVDIAELRDGSLLLQQPKLLSAL